MQAFVCNSKRHPRGVGFANSDIKHMRLAYLGVHLTLLDRTKEVIVHKDAGATESYKTSGSSSIDTEKLRKVKVFWVVIDNFKGKPRLSRPLFNETNPSLRHRPVI
jgi:hypothetical protein